MSASTKNNGCPKCKRSSFTPIDGNSFLPWVLLQHMPPNQYGLTWDAEFLINAILNNFNGTMSQHCLNAVKKEIQTKMDKAIENWMDANIDYLAFDKDKNPQPCYGALLNKNFKIEVECTCNDEDIEQGKTPKAEIKSDNISFQFGEVACPSTPPPTAGPPDIA